MSPSSADTSPPPRATRRRGASLTGAIYLIALEELAETSFDKLSFDKIAASAGTGKASLYRRWATPAELVLDALSDPVAGFGEAREPETGSVRTDLLVVLGGLARTFELPLGRAFVPLVTQRARHPELHARVRSLIIQPRQDVALRILAAAAERGEVDPAAVTPRIAAVGPRLVIADHMDHGAVSAAEVEAIVDEVLMPLITARRDG